MTNYGKARTNEKTLSLASVALNVEYNAIYHFAVYNSSCGCPSGYPQVLGCIYCTINTSYFHQLKTCKPMQILCL